MTWEDLFVQQLADIRLGNVFNPYSDHCMIYDLPNAAKIRRNNLSAVLKTHYANKIESIWFGRDLGYRGGRRTGLALTDEVTMLSEAKASWVDHPIERATHGPIVREKTATVIWSVIRRLQYAPLLWNAFPFHPHEPDYPLSNRSHSVRERKETAWAIEALIERFDNPRLIAIGNDASKALADLGFKHENVRHPSYGGQREFVVKMEDLHSLISPPVEILEPPLV